MDNQVLHLQTLNQEPISIGFDYGLLISELADFLKGDEPYQFDILLFRDQNRTQQLDKALSLQQAGIQPGNVLYYNQVPVVHPSGMRNAQQFPHNGFPFNSPPNQQNQGFQPPPMFIPSYPETQQPIQGLFPQQQFPQFPGQQFPPVGQSDSPQPNQTEMSDLLPNQGRFKTSVVTISESGEQVTCRDEQNYINFNLYMKNSNLNADIKIVQKEIAKLIRSDNSIASSLTVNGTVVVFYEAESGYGIVIYWKNKNRSKVVFYRNEI